MAMSKSPPPYFGSPPREYDQRYMADLTRAFAQFVQQQMNPGEGRFTTVVLTDLPNSDYALPPGALFEQDGSVFITKASNPFPSGLTLATDVGDVTVVIS